MNRKLLSLTLIAVCVAVLGAKKSALAQTTGETKRVECVKRVATIEPPRIELPGRRAYEGKEQEIPPARRLKPVCPEGEVPVTAFPTTKHFIKGNPMIGNYAAPGPAHRLTVRPGLLETGTKTGTEDELSYSYRRSAVRWSGMVRQLLLLLYGLRAANCRWRGNDILDRKSGRR